MKCNVISVALLPGRHGLRLHMRKNAVASVPQKGGGELSSVKLSKRKAEERSRLKEENPCCSGWQNVNRVYELDN